MKMITGIYNTSVDEKGRILLPSRMRSALMSQELVALPGLDENHLMLMTPSYFEDRFSQAVLSSDTAMFDKGKRSLIRKLIAPAVYIELDASGRVNIPLSLREKYSILNKTDVALVGTGFSIEVWNKEIFDRAEEEDTTSLSDLAEKLKED